MTLKRLSAVRQSSTGMLDLKNIDGTRDMSDMMAMRRLGLTSLPGVRMLASTVYFNARKLMKLIVPGMSFFGTDLMLLVTGFRLVKTILRILGSQSLTETEPRSFRLDLSLTLA